jgi:hypothetical protein
VGLLAADGSRRGESVVVMGMSDARRRLLGIVLTLSVLRSADDTRGLGRRDDVVPAP